MARTIGINQELLLSKSEYIREAWNDYIWDSTFCQKRIKFTDEQKTNYIGDLLNYLDDTIHLLSSFKINNDYRSALYDNIAVLQLMYIQQDLIDELLFIFKQQSSSNNKKLIRTLRNELVGHPVSRDKEGLISSVFITAESKGDTLQYIRYHKDNNFKFDLKSHNWQEIFNTHNQFLLEYFDILLREIDSILLAFKKNLLVLLNAIPQAQFIDILKFVQIAFERHYKGVRLFFPENIKYCYEREKSHNRYEHSIKIYLDGLKHYIKDTISDIDNFIDRDSLKEEKKDTTFIKIFFSPENATDVSSEPVGTASPQRDYHYQMSKLAEKENHYLIQYMQGLFKNDPEIITELENMNMHLDNDAEYYSSYEYLRLLLKKRGHKL